MDSHKETINMSQCDQYQKIIENESRVTSLKDDMCEIKTSVSGMCKQMTEMMSTVQMVVMKLDERDKQSTENTKQTKETFVRFGTKIDKLDIGIRTLELDLAKASSLEHKVSTLEKVVYRAGSASITAIAAVLFWLIQKNFG